MSMVREALIDALSGNSLSAERIRAVLDEVLDGDAPSALVAGLLVALRCKGEAPEELAGGVRALLARARKVDIDSHHLLDTAGTGGDGKRTFNISTGAALIAAAAGVRVAKHGNRAASGNVGAADVLEQMGVRIELAPEALKRCLERAGICFIFAPHYHPALAQVATLRRELGVRTIFNLLGPLANPCRPDCHLLGVGERKFAPPIAQALRQLGVRHAMVVHSVDGMDEISAAAPTEVWEVKRSEIRNYTIEPARFGADSDGVLVVRDAAEAAVLLRAALAGQAGAAQDVLALNGGAAIYVGDKAATLAEGVEMARALLRQGAGLAKLEALRQASREEA